ncbi:MAG: tetratricopeptide repeat protein [Candidatus Heimdallarchaeaceae archaeon]
MISKGEQKRFLKMLKSKHVIERLDSLHDMKKLDLGASFAFSALVDLVNKDPDDLVRINALDILAVLAGESQEALAVIQDATLSDTLGVKKKAERLLLKIKDVFEDILEPDEGPQPLTDELFEKVETTVESEGEMPIPVIPTTVPTPTPTPISFDHTEELSDDFGAGETDSGIYVAQPPPMAPGAVFGAPTGSIPMAPGMKEPTEEDTADAAEEVAKDVELEDLSEAPIPSTYKNLQILLDNIEEEEDQEIISYAVSMIEETLNFLTNHLMEIIGVEEELDWKKFMEYKFESEEITFMEKILVLVAGGIESGKLSFEDLDILNVLGSLAQKLEMIEETIVFYHAVVKIDSKNVVSMYNLGLLYAKIGKFDEAIQQLKPILKHDENHVATIIKLGDMFFHGKNDFDSAGEYYQRAFNLQPDDCQTGLKLASVLSKKESYEEATHIIFTLLKDNNEDPDLWLNYAVLLVKQVKFDGALEAYNKALNIAPEDWSFREKAESEKERVEQIVNAPEYTEIDDENLKAMVGEDKKIYVDKVFIFAKNPLEDEVFMAIFDWFKTSKTKYLVAEGIIPKYGSIMSPEEFPIDPLRAQSFAEVVWGEQFESELSLATFYHELYDLDNYGKIIFFMESES